jgi:TetR/AcrR family transcriptional regulator, transcriptional repressor for nem operon
MARSREYDPELVLTGAMRAFRRHGYRGASMRDLETATGLSAGSIYNSFGDKAGLFDAAFAHYNEAVLQLRIDSFAPPKRGLGGLRELFLSLLREPDRGTLGCLITNSAVEFGSGRKQHPCVLQGLERLERTFRERLTAARQAGSLREGVSPKDAAVQLLALYQGVLVLVRAGHASAALQRLINHEFDQLEDAR